MSAISPVEASPVSAPSEMTVLWLKVHESFGFTGVSAGNSRADIDNDMPQPQVDALLGEGTYARLEKAAENRTQDLEVSFGSVLRRRGWVEDESLYASNGDVAAFAYRRIDDKD